MYFVNMFPSYLIFDEYQTILSSVMQYKYKRLGTKIKSISSCNHDSLKTERHVRTISEMIAKQLTCTGLMWTHYLQIFPMHIIVLTAWH